MRRTALLVALLLALAGCGGGAGDSPSTPDKPGRLAFFHVTYDAAGVIDGVDTTAAPILWLWDQPGGQANLVAAVLGTYYYPIPDRFRISQTTWAGSPRAAFVGTWSGAHAPGDSIVLAYAYLDGLPDSVYDFATGHAVARWDTAPGLDLARVRADAYVHKGAAVETLTTFYVLGRVRTGWEVFP